MNATALVPRAYRYLTTCVVLMLSLAFLAIAGCGVTENRGADPTTVPTVLISTSATSIQPGGSAMLTVVATKATTVMVTGSDGSTYNMSASGGTQSVSPKATTVYTATATSASKQVTATTTVTVAAISAGAPTVTVVANPTSVAPGAASTLTVTATNATQVALTGSDGSTYTLSPTGGTQSVTPPATTTYTATATGAGGSITATATVTVSSTPAPTAPTVTISAAPMTVNAGSSSTLTISAANATQVTVTGSDNTTYTLAATGGTQVVTPAATTTYTAKATGTGGNASANVIVTVNAQGPPPAPTVTLTANPTSIVAGTSSTLTVAATNATKLVITGSDGSSYNIAANGGTQIVTPTTTTTYTASATGAGGNVMATAVVTVTAAPPPAVPTVTITSNPGTINDGSSTTLTVTATNATQVVLTGTDGTTYTLPGAGGTQAVSPTTTTSYQATASGPGGSATASTVVTVNAAAHATVAITASPASVTSGNASSLTVTATNATQVTIAGSDGSSYTLQPSGGTQSVTPKATTTYTATATAAGGNATASATVTVNAPGSLQSVDHVLFMLQENHSFDNYFGMLNPYRKSNGFSIGDDGKEYDIDGIDDKLQTISNQTDEGTSYKPFKFATTCIDDVSSSWLESYGDVNRYDFLTSRPILMDGFVHDAEGFAKSCVASKSCSGTFSDTTGQRVMGYYDQGFLNYYYYMASQFAVSNRWFSPMSSKSIPNRIATFTGGTTQGLVYDPGSDDKLPQLNIDNIFARLDKAGVSWKIYYTVTNGLCANQDDCTGTAAYPATSFSTLSYSYQYLYGNPNHAQCTGSTKPSSTVGDTSNSFCIDPNHIAPIDQYFTDLKNGTLPSFGFIEAGYGRSDEHPGSGQSILSGQAQVANIVNSLMGSSSWKDSVFFLAYDEGGGPYDHVPPVPGHSNDFSPLFKATAPDISGIAVNPDSYRPCVPATTPATTNCDLRSDAPGANSGDAAATQGFAAQLGFRVPNMVISPFTRKHYVSNYPMDHTAVIRFVEKRFIGDSSSPLTARDAAQPDLLDFFDFTGTPWATPPAPPAPVTPQTLGYDPCKPDAMQ